MPLIEVVTKAGLTVFVVYCSNSTLHSYNVINYLNNVLEAIIRVNIHIIVSCFKSIHLSLIVY